MNADAVKNITKFSFVALLVTGGVIAAAVIGINELKSDNLPETTPPAQTLATDSNGNSVYVDDGNEYTIIEENSPADTENPSAETTAAQTSASPSQTTATTTANAAPAGVMSISATASNSWENGGMIYTQVDFVITNNANSVSDWTVLMPIPANSRIEQSWNGVYTVEGANMRVRPDGTNANINSGSSVNFGCIIASPEPITNPSPSVN